VRHIVARSLKGPQAGDFAGDATGALVRRSTVVRVFQLAESQAAAHSHVPERWPGGPEMPARSVCYVKLSTGRSAFGRISAVVAVSAAEFCRSGSTKRCRSARTGSSSRCSVRRRNIESLHHGADLSATLDSGRSIKVRSKGLDLLGERAFRFIRDRPRRHAARA